MKIIVNRFVLFCTVLSPAFAQGQQLLTMSNKCFKQVQAGNQQNDQGAFQEASDTFTSVLKNCSAKDAKIEGNVGLAIASNGLQQYESAIKAADNAIKVSKKTSVMAYYARSYANGHLGRVEDAKADLVKITDLTSKNRDVKARATMFAKLASLDVQLNRREDANTHLQKAMELDPKNPAFYIQSGDMRVKAGNYEDAFVAYDKAIDLGKNDLEIYQIRTEARLLQVQQKYKTTDIKELSGRMSTQEKRVLCADMKRALDLGLRSLQLDLLSSAICE